MKFLSTFIISIFLFSQLTTPAFALVAPKVDPSGVLNDEKNIRIGEPNPKGDRMEKRVGTLQARAEREIMRRITSLQKLQTRLETIKSLSAEEKKTLDKQIQTEIESLTDLQAKIKANTDPTTLKTDVQKIVTSYRIYALFMPKISIIVAADRIGDTVVQLNLIAAKLQTKIATAKTEGKDVTTLENALADMQKKIADAKTQEQNAINAVLPLTPEGYPGNKSTLEAARGMLKLGYQDLVGARKDVQTIITGLSK